MKNRLLRIARALTAEPVVDEVHFHADASGRAFACDYARCSSPGLDIARA
jgi:hypothetical protein